MKTTYYLTTTGIVIRATTAIAREKLARIAAKELCKPISPKTAKNMIDNGTQFIKVQDL